MIQSPMNRPYSELAGSRGSLANRPAVPVGRGGLDLNRIAEQRFRQSGNPSLLFRQQYSNTLPQGRGFGGLPPPPQQTQGAPLPQFLPPLPGSTPPPGNPGGRPGRFIPGISTGSQVWVPDPVSLSPVPVQSAPTATPAQTSAEPAPTPRAAAVSAPPAPPPPDFGNLIQPLPAARLPDGALDVTQPLPPSTLNGSNGLPPPPAIDFQPLPGNPNYGVPIINGEAQRQFLPVPPLPTPQPPPLSAAELGQANAAGFEPTQINGSGFDPQGVPYLRKKEPDKMDKPNITWQDGVPYHITMDAKGNPQVRKLAIIDANGDGIDDRTQGGAAAAPAQPRTTSSGVRVQVTPT